MPEQDDVRIIISIDELRDWSSACLASPSPLRFVDTETTGLSQRHDRLAGVSVAYRDGEVWRGAYMPVLHAFDPVLPMDEVKVALSGLFRDRRIVKVFFNAAFDIHFLREAGFPTPLPFEDARPMAWLTDERDKPHDLKSLAKKYAGLEMTHYKDLARLELEKRKEEWLENYLASHDGLRARVPWTFYQCPACVAEGKPVKTTWKKRPTCTVHKIDYSEDAPWPIRLGAETITVKPEVDAPANITEVRHSIAGQYAAEDAIATGKLYERLRGNLDRCPRVEDHYRKVALPLVPVIHRMESRGIAVDMDHFARLRVEAETALGEVTEKIRQVYPEDYSLTSNRDKIRFFTEDLKLPATATTPTGQPKVDKYAMKEWKRQGIEIASLFMEHDDWDTLLNSFLIPLPSFVEAGRLYTHFDPCATRTGRLNSSRPNVQQSTNKHDYRMGFIAPPGRALLVADFKQMELVMCAHYAREPEMIRALTSGEDLHRKTVSHALGKQAEEVTGPERKIGKAQNFGLIFRQSAKGFDGFLRRNDIILPPDEVKRYYEGFFSLYQRIRPWHDEVIAKVGRFGFIETITGRRRRLPEAFSSDRSLREWAYRRAINTTVQGCLDGSSMVFEKDHGYVPIKALEGQRVTLWDGNQWATGYVAHSGKKQLVNLELMGGYQIGCSPDHRFLTRNVLGQEFWRTPKMMLEVKSTKVVIGDALPLHRTAQAVKSIEVTDQYVDMYDFVNSSTGRFMAGGMIVHNSCADLVKLGMIAHDKLWQGSGQWIEAMIHDELICEIDEGYADQAIADVRGCYEHVFDLSVPMTLDIHVVDAWGKAK